MADSSAVNSITASAFAEQILSALPNRITIPSQVVTELELGSQKGYDNARVMHELIKSGHAEVVTMDKATADDFYKTIIGQAGSKFGNGEAATMACALELDGIPLLDERKARHIWRQRFPGLAYRCTVDIFAHPEVRKKLGDADLKCAVLNALKTANMRVIQKHMDWVVSVIGAENLADCDSIPNSVQENHEGKSG